MDSSDGEILARASNGDAAALTDLLQTHTPMLFAELKSKIPDRLRTLLAVDDILQETFTDVFLSIGKFVSQGGGAFAAWLRKLAQNNLLEAIRALDADKRGGGRRPASFGTGTDAYSELTWVLLPAASQTTPSQHAAQRFRYQEILDKLIMP